MLHTTDSSPIRLNRWLLAVLLLVPQASVFADHVVETVQRLEAELGGTIGLFVRDLQTGQTIAYRADGRFPLNSTFKLFACAALLARVESKESDLAERIDLRNAELVTYSPAVQRSISEGRTEASLDALCAMMLAVSDNTAANLVLQELGGPDGFTAYMRAIGDDITTLNRWEPALNEGLPGDQRDTTTPRAISDSLERLLLGDALSLASRETLSRWLAGHAVADDLFRSVLPRDWSIQDRTGAGANGTRAIVAILYPPAREPIVASVFMRDTTVNIGQRNAAIGRSLITGLDGK